MAEIDVLSIIVIVIDLLVSSFLIWRAIDKKATLWGSARAIYMWVAALTIYHCIIYTISLSLPHPFEDQIIVNFLHPIVMLYVLNPLLIAIIHYRGGHLL